MGAQEKDEVLFFNVIHNDGLIQVSIDKGFAVIEVDHLEDAGVLVRAINRAGALGAKKGTLFTGEIVNEREAEKVLRRAARGTTWLDGKLTRLPDGKEGPQFRIDWQEFPHITERSDVPQKT